MVAGEIYIADRKTTAHPIRVKPSDISTLPVPGSPSLTALPVREKPSQITTPRVRENHPPGDSKRITEKKCNLFEFDPTKFQNKILSITESKINAANTINNFDYDRNKFKNIVMSLSRFVNETKKRIPQLK